MPHLPPRLAALALAALMAAAPAHADYPDKPIRFVVPVPPGGAGDMVSRLTATAAGRDLGQTLVVENRPGATGNIGTVAAVRSPGDGYTVLLCSIGNCAVNSSLYADPGFDLFRDIVPVVLIGSSINVLTTHPDSGIDSVDGLIAKARAGSVSYGSSGVGASNHLAGEMLKQRAGIDLLHVPYRGSGPAITDLLGGQIQVFFDNEPSILPFVTSGKVKALAVTGKTRSRHLPDVPTLEELGYDGFVIEPWYAIAAPAGTPDAAIARLNAAFNAGLQDAAVRDTLLKAGIQPAGGSPGVLGEHIRREHARWAELIQTQKISAE